MKKITKHFFTRLLEGSGNLLLQSIKIAKSFDKTTALLNKLQNQNKLKL